MIPDIPILAQTPHWVVISKPPGIFVHRSDLDRRQPALLQYVRDLLGTHVYPVHRLDRPTSGCLLFALSPEWAKTLQQALTHKDAKKTYIALVRGFPKEHTPQKICRPLQNEHGVMRDASTSIQWVTGSKNPRCGLVLARPHTGRTHQIRRHLNGIGHPILGDSSHGDTRINQWWRDHYQLPRLALHCGKLDLPLGDGERLTVHGPIPMDLRNVLEKLPWYAKEAHHIEALCASFNDS